MFQIRRRPWNQIKKKNTLKDKRRYSGVEKRRELWIKSNKHLFSFEKINFKFFPWKRQKYIFLFIFLSFFKYVFFISFTLLCKIVFIGAKEQTIIKKIQGFFRFFFEKNLLIKKYLIVYVTWPVCFNMFLCLTLIFHKLMTYKQ